MSIFEWTTGEDWLGISANNFVSPVINSLSVDNILLAVTCVYLTPNDSSMSIAFRSSDSNFAQNDNSVIWSGFTMNNQIPSNVETSLFDLGIFIKGQYLQAQIHLDPFSGSTPFAEQEDTPSITFLSVNVSAADTLISPSSIAYIPGTVLGQIISFDNTKSINKVSLDLAVTNNDRKEFIVGSFDRVSWSAINFQSYRENWVFQPIYHWISGLWNTSGMTIQNTLQYDDYITSAESFSAAPYLKYSLFIPSGGVWNMWGFGYSFGNIFYSIDDGSLQTLKLGSTDPAGLAEVPYWTKFGTLFFEEGGLHSFTVFLSENNTVIFDQWLFTTEANPDIETYTSSLPLSKGPYMTIVRLRNLEGDYPVPLSDPPKDSVVVASYKSSTEILESGKHNYLIQNNSSGAGVQFSNGVSLEYIQIGGSSNYCASWNFVL